MDIEIYLKVSLFASFLVSVYHSLAVPENVLKSINSAFMRNKEQGIGFASFKKHEYRHLNVTPIVVLRVTSRKECAIVTAMSSTAFSFNFAILSDIHGLHRCELLDTDLFNDTNKLMNSLMFCHYSIVIPCDKSPCQNGGSCLALYENDDYKCQCSSGFEGRNCEIEIDECASNPCLNNGTCVNLLNSYSCNCTDEYNGTTCATKVCKPTWEQWQNFCYKILVQKLSWTDALSVCQTYGSSLASITSQEENSYVVNLAKGRASSGYLWIGLTDQAQEGKFVWADGKALGYVNWQGGAAHIDSGKNCIDILLSSAEWFDYYCSTALSSACKYSL